MRTVQLPQATIGSYVSLIESQPGEYRNFFRGQRDAGWSLLPSLYRNPNINVSARTRERSYDAFENQAIERFFREGLPYLPPIARSFSNDRILAQHFGVPTRLLDWSRDPLVALFFAVEGGDIASDAAVFGITPEASYLPEEGARLGQHQVVELVPPAIDRRIPAQKSVFTFHPYGDPDMDYIPLDQRENIGGIYVSIDRSDRGFFKLIIPAAAKRRLWQSLLQIGVDHRNLFPGLEGVGRDIAARSANGSLL